MDARKIGETSDNIQRILADFESPFQATILADVVALWLAGHSTERPQKTSRLREQLWREFTAAVHRLLPIKDQLVRANLKNLKEPR